MNNFKKLRNEVRAYLALILVLYGFVMIAAWWLMYVLGMGPIVSVIFMVGLNVAIAITISDTTAEYVLDPLRMLHDAVMHVAPGSNAVTPPDINKAHLGRELLSSLTLQVYQFASQAAQLDSPAQFEHREGLIQASNVVDHLPLPLFVFNKEQLVTNASSEALKYLKLDSSALFGKLLFDSVNMDFPSDRTLDAWINECQKNKVTDTATWERVRITLQDGVTVKQCDIAAYYNRDNPSGTEFIVTLFDRTVLYDQDDANLSFVALAVHELRTPLTMLRGYIEVLQDELEGKADEEMQEFLHKMSYSAQSLSTFINNILNVARVESNQLVLHLREEKWDDVLKTATADLELRAQVHGKVLEFRIADGLPTVACDRVSIGEVVTNLIDNAMKYSGDSKQIIITAGLSRDGMIETTVQDFGVGIPTSVVPSLFQKFYRNHRTRSQIGGSGLGLYLCKSIVNAHSGQIWVNSHDGEGSTFGFTLLPYSQLTDEQKTGNTDIVRGAHGWIKNHSMYRR